MHLHDTLVLHTQPAMACLCMLLPGTSNSHPNIVKVLRERGLIQELTNDELEKAAATTSLSVYCGFDPTADSLHLGNLLGIIVLSWFQRCGHTPVALLGGATGRVGDPSGRSTERPVLSEEQIEHNVAGEASQGMSPCCTLYKTHDTVRTIMKCGVHML